MHHTQHQLATFARSFTMMMLSSSYVCKINDIEMVVFTIDSLGERPVLSRISDACRLIYPLCVQETLRPLFTLFLDGGQ